MRLMIVDDERMIREGIVKRIPLASMGISHIRQAEDGVLAWEQFLEQPADLMIIDVKMPRLDGIALARRVREHAPDTQMIFLSGYSDKEYLRSAIQVQAVEYVDKPINLDRLGEAIEKMAKAFDSAQRVRQLSWAAEKNRGQMVSTWFAQVLADHTGQTEEAAVLQLCSLLGVPEPEQPLMLCVAVLPMPYHDRAAEVARLLPRFLPAVAASSVGRGEAAALVYQPMRGTAVLMEGLDGLQGACCCPLALVRSNPFAAHDDLKQYAGQVRQAFATLFYGRWGQIYEAPFSGMDDALPAASGPALYAGRLETADEAGALDILADSVQHIRASGQIPPAEVRRYVGRFLSAVENSFLAGVEGIVAEADQCRSAAHCTHMLEELEGLMRLFTANVAGRLRAESAHAVVAGVNRFIRENLSSPIHIRDVAKHLHLSPNHLGAVYRRHSGRTLLETLTECRIEEAKRLLQDRSKTLLEVAEAVGYQDVNYFTKVFRRCTGGTPSDYRSIGHE